MAGNPLGVVLSVLGLILSAAGLAANVGILSIAASPGTGSERVASTWYDSVPVGPGNIDLTLTAAFSGEPTGVTFWINQTGDATARWGVDLRCGGTGSARLILLDSWETIRGKGWWAAYTLSIGPWTADNPDYIGGEMCRLQLTTTLLQGTRSQMGAKAYIGPAQVILWALRAPPPLTPPPPEDAPVNVTETPGEDVVEDVDDAGGLACEPGLTYDEVSETCIVPRPPWTAYLFIALLAVILIASAVVAVSFFWGKS